MAEKQKGSTRNIACRIRLNEDENNILKEGRLKMDRTALIKEKELRLNILGIHTTSTPHACFGTDKRARSIPFYGNWFHFARITYYAILFLV